MEVDSVLLQHVEELCSGEIVHFRANLSGVYRSSLEEFECIGGYLPVDCGGSSSGVVNSARQEASKARVAAQVGVAISSASPRRTCGKGPWMSGDFS